MEEIILNTIKKMLGISNDCEDFDTDIIMHINTVFMVLNQLGIGPDEGFRIENKTEAWSDYLTDKDDLEAVKTYMYLKVKLLFDPPLNSAVLESLQNSIKEFEWRLTVKAEDDKKNEEV